MSRMLEALRRIEAKTAASADAGEVEPGASATQSEARPEAARRAQAAMEKLESSVAHLCAQQPEEADAAAAGDAAASAPAAHASQPVAPAVGAAQAGAPVADVPAADVSQADVPAADVSQADVPAADAPPDVAPWNLEQPSIEPAASEGFSGLPRAVDAPSVGRPAIKPTPPAETAVRQAAGAQAGPPDTPVTFQPGARQPAMAPAEPPSSRPDALAEACERLAENIVARLPVGPSAAVFVADVGHSEARTELLAELLPVLARRADTELLAVDADLQRGQLTARLGVLAVRGAAHVLLRACAWQEAVGQTCLPGVRLLPSVSFADPEGRLLRPYRWERLFAELRRRFRLIVVDGGSLPEGPTSPAARYCDSAYLVVCLGRTAYRQAAAAAAALRCRGARVEGCIAVGAERVERAG